MDSPDLSWILDLINNFTHGIKEYKVNTEIKYMEYEKLVEIGIV